MTPRRWQSPDRFMTAHLERDLLGDLVLCVAYGGLHNRRGQLRSIPVPDAPAAEALVAALDKKRLRRGYSRA